MKKYVIISIIVIIIIYMSRNKLIKTAFNEMLSKNFQLGELLVTSQPLPNIPDEKEIANLRLLTVNVLQPIRDLLNVPITINSAFRSNDVNKAIGGVDNSQHRIGFAADIVPNGINIDEAFKKIGKSTIPFDQLIIETNQRNNRWIHVSFNPSKGRRQLLSATWNFDKNKMDYKNVVL